MVVYQEDTREAERRETAKMDQKMIGYPTIKGVN
jgi:hypothetical protein